MSLLRFAISPCPNDVFIFAGLLLGRIPTPGAEPVFTFADIQVLNERAEAGDFDVVKVSYARVPFLLSRYALLEPGGALGHGVGPLLLTGGDPFSPAVEVAVPGRFTTANLLLDFAYPEGLKKTFLHFDAIYEGLKGDRRSQGVVIHEKRFTYAADGLRLVRDLGLEYEAKTGLPIPLGALLCKKGLGLDREVEGWVRESLAWAEAHREEALDLCQHHARALSRPVVSAHVDLYVNSFSKAWGEEGKKAVEHFLGLAAS